MARTAAYTVSLHDALPIYHVGGRVAQHALGADVEDLNDALLVSGDAREVGAVKDRALEGPCLEQSLFRPLAGAVVGSDQRSEEHTSELQPQFHLVCRLLLE